MDYSQQQQPPIAMQDNNNVNNNGYYQQQPRRQASTHSFSTQYSTLSTHLPPMPAGGAGAPMYGQGQQGQQQQPVRKGEIERETYKFILVFNSLLLFIHSHIHLIQP